jgi:hypothetical protein
MLEKSLLTELPDVLTPKEAAHVLRLGRNTTYELIRSGKETAWKEVEAVETMERASEPIRLESWRDLDVHRARTSLPMDVEASAALEQSISTVGFDPNCPIVLHEGKVLDGCQRLGICEQDNVEPLFVNWLYNGVVPEEWFLRVNLIRRHLTAIKRAAVAVEYVSRF